MLNGAPQLIVVEPGNTPLNQPKCLDLRSKPLTVRQTYSVRWQKEKIDLMKLAKMRWINQMSFKDIADSQKMTLGGVDWNLRKFKKEYSKNRSTKELKQIWSKIEGV